MYNRIFPLRFKKIRLAEVDPEVLIARSEGELSIGSFYQAMVTQADDFDLYATLKK